jgi:transcriptional regulator with XRE-family HTH domain
MNCQDIERGVVPFYRAIMIELERRRLSRGLSMQEICDHSGLADYYYSKALHASTPSGRQARWDSLQDLVDALFPEGYDVEIRPKVGMRLSAADLRCKIKSAAALTDRKSQREFMRELGRLGGVARREKFKNMTPEERKAIAEKGRKTKRQNQLLRAQIRKPEPKSRKRRGALAPCVVAPAIAAPSCSMDDIRSPAAPTKDRNGYDTAPA